MHMSKVMMFLLVSLSFNLTVVASKDMEVPMKQNQNINITSYPKLAFQKD